MQARLQDREDQGLRPLRLAVVERGAGPRLLLVHSSGLGAVQWSLVQARLEQRFRSVAVDLCGYGGSPAGGFAEDVDGLVELIDEHTVVCGHSYGSFVALHASRRRLPRSLVLLEPVCFDLLRQVSDPEGLAQLARLEANAEFWDPARAGSEEWLRGFTEYWNGPGAWEQMSARRRRRQVALGPKLFEEVVTAWRDETPGRVWAELGCPVRVAVGEGTTVAARRVGEVLAATVGCPLELAEGGHMFPLTHPDEVCRLLAGEG